MNPTLSFAFISLYFLLSSLQAQNYSSMDNYTFSLKLYQEMVKSDPEGNLFLAPQSVKNVLQMTQLGSAGSTRKEVADLLGKEPIVDYSQQQGALKSANALWGPAGFEFHTDFIADLQENRAFHFKELNFHKPEKARHRINTWVAHETGQQIEELLPKGSLDANTALVLSNALYFKSDWAIGFDASQTQQGDFQLANGQSVSVPFMHLRQAKLSSILYREERSYQSLLLPYDNEDYGMLLLLPKKGVSLAEVEQQVLQAEALTKLLQQLKSAPVKVQLPKFKMQQNHSLAPVLKSLGMPTAFTEQADFSKMTRGDNKLYLSNVFHAAALDLSESGTEASAASGAVIKSRGIAPKEQLEEFIADRPFCFLIIDRNKNNILFAGRLANP